MPEAGEELKCRIFKGGSITVTLDDRVYPDRSCGQYEAGWWVDCEGEDFFLSESGILYDADYEKVYQGHTRACGIHVPWAKMVKQADMELLKFATDEEINRSFDAYR